jgi:hypothetical protein
VATARVAGLVGAFGRGRGPASRRGTGLDALPGAACRDHADVELLAAPVPRAGGIHRGRCRRVLRPRPGDQGSRRQAQSVRPGRGTPVRRGDRPLRERQVLAGAGGAAASPGTAARPLGDRATVRTGCRTAGELRVESCRRAAGHDRRAGPDGTDPGGRGRTAVPGPAAHGAGRTWRTGAPGRRPARGTPHVDRSPGPGRVPLADRRVARGGSASVGCGHLAIGFPDRLPGDRIRRADSPADAGRRARPYGAVRGDRKARGTSGLELRSRGRGTDGGRHRRRGRTAVAGVHPSGTLPADRLRWDGDGGRLPSPGHGRRGTVRPGGPHHRRLAEGRCGHACALDTAEIRDPGARRTDPPPRAPRGPHARRAHRDRCVRHRTPAHQRQCRAGRRP